MAARLKSINRLSLQATERVVVVHVQRRREAVRLADLSRRHRGVRDAIEADSSEQRLPGVDDVDGRPAYAGTSLDVQLSGQQLGRQIECRVGGHVLTGIDGLLA